MGTFLQYKEEHAGRNRVPFVDFRDKVFGGNNIVLEGLGEYLLDFHSFGNRQTTCEVQKNLPSPHTLPDLSDYLSTGRGAPGPDQLMEKTAPGSDCY